MAKIAVLEYSYIRVTDYSIRVADYSIGVSRS